MKIIVSLGLVLLSLIVVSPVRAAEQQVFKVIKVVDGDTIVVDVRGKRETVRLLGIDTPETVDPRKPVQCFGKAASEKMKNFVDGKSVILVDDSTQGNRDQYKRLLRYVYLPNSTRTFVNGEMVKQGYAFSFREYPTKMISRFNAWEAYAREHNLGLWGSCNPTAKPTMKPRVPTKATESIPTQQTQSVPRINTSSGGDKDCKDFATQADAQAYFNSKGGSASNNVDRLDGNDHDGLVCEALP